MFPSKLAIIKFVFVDFMFIKNNIIRGWYQVAVWNSFDTSTAKRRCPTKMIMWYFIYPLQIYRSSWNLKSLYDIRQHLYGQKISNAIYNNKISWLQHLFYRLAHWGNCANTGVVKCLYLGNTQITLYNEECSLLKTLSSNRNVPIIGKQDMISSEFRFCH